MYPQEKQVCSLDQAKKLVELSVVLDTEKYWVSDTRQKPYYLKTKISNPELSETPEFTKTRIDSMMRLYPGQAYPAPNVAELGVLLPKEVFFPCEGRGHYYKSELTCYWFDGDWYADYTKSGSTESLHTFKAETEAQARAEALIGLLENEQLKPEDLKL